MRRVYNDKISEKANKNLAKRAAVVRHQRRVLAIIIIAIIFFGVLLGTGISALANSDKGSAQYKYYTSVRIEDGDTLWNIADKYIQGTNIDHKTYIKEICELNSICADEIHAGNYIIVYYYSDELK